MEEQASLSYSWPQRKVFTLWPWRRRSSLQVILVHFSSACVLYALGYFCMCIDPRVYGCTRVWVHVHNSMYIWRPEVVWNRHFLLFPRYSFGQGHSVKHRAHQYSESLAGLLSEPSPQAGRTGRTIITSSDIYSHFWGSKHQSPHWPGKSLASESSLQLWVLLNYLFIHSVTYYF